MTSLIIKVSKDGSSREYSFNRPGPILIGTDENCDVRLPEKNLEAKLFEVKLSSEGILIKELGIRAEIFLNSVILPHRKDTLYRPGQTITLANSHCQIQVSTVGDVSVPPPFEDEYKLQLQNLQRQIKGKEDQILLTEKIYEKKKFALENVDATIKNQLGEKSKRELEITSLKKKQAEISIELERKRTQFNQQKNGVDLLKDHVSKLNDEHKSLNENILKHESTLFRLRGDIECCHQEIQGYKQKLVDLVLQERKKKSLLLDLQLEFDQRTNQSANESQKLTAIMNQTEISLKEKKSLELKLEQLKKEKSDSSKSMEQLQSLMHEQLKVRKETELKLQNLSFEIERSELHHHKIKEDILMEKAREQQLKTLNEELHLEIARLDDKLALKKNQYNQLDYQTQDELKQLARLKVETDKATFHLKELSAEEKTQESKTLELRKEWELFQIKSETQKKISLESFEELKAKRNQENLKLETQIEDHRIELKQLQSSLKELEMQHADFISVNRSLFNERSEMQTKVEALTHHCVELGRMGNIIKEKNTSYSLEKNRLENELSVLKLKLVERESNIKKKASESFLEIENLKRDARSRLHSERDLMLAEVEAQKQKSLIELDSSFKTKQEQLDIIKDEKFRGVEQTLNKAREEAAQLLANAREIEQSAASEAANRLHQATQEATRREQKSHSCIQAAQEYFKGKETEAEAVILTSKKMADEIVRKAERKLLEDLDQGKKRIKEYLTHKQKKADQYFLSLEQTQHQRFKKEQLYQEQRLEGLRRKELKKISQIKDEELARSTEMKTHLMNQAKASNLEALAHIEALKKRQEEELHETRKTLLEHMSQNKMRQQQALEQELGRDRDLFEQTKRQRVQIASQGILNLLITSLGSLPPGDLKEQIESTLEMSINGQSPEQHKRINQILDYNPLKKKEVWPMLQKYSIRFGIPAAIALTLIGDLGSLRSGFIKFSSNLLKQNQSASDIFVKKQNKEWKEKYTFNTVTTVGYKKSLTDNILYTRDYYKIMESEAFQNAWILAVNNFMVQELELSEDLAINYISSEGSTVKELWAIRKDIHPQFKEQSFKKMRSLETASMGWLQVKIPDAGKMKKFNEFRKNYFDNFHASNNKQFRTLASDQTLEE